MKYGIVIGSHRQESQSSKVGHFIDDTFKKLFSHHTTYLLSLANNPLPLWDEEVWQKSEKWQKIWAPISAELLLCDAFIIISPEWSGMVPAGLKNFFLLCDKGELRHKPGLIVTVSASMGGAYPVTELRMSSYKNTGICYIPEHVIVRHVEKILNDFHSSVSDEDTYIRNRLTYALRLIDQYAIALKLVRESGVVDSQTYPFGM